MSTTDRLEYLPGTREILDVFTDEITSLGGTVPNAYDDGARLFARAVLPADTEVTPGDHIRAGVAVRVTGAEICVHPYTFRQVCSNGAIAAHALQTRRLERVPSTGMFAPTYDVALALTDFRLAVQACASPEAFKAVASEMRSAAEMNADLFLYLLPSLANMPEDMVEYLVPLVVDRFTLGADRSVFGLLNAVTSAARDARDPETRWRLEELGGTMPAHLERKPRTRPTVPALMRA
jgi:hypothetical protein